MLVAGSHTPQLEVQEQLTPPFESTVQRYPVIHPHFDGLMTVPLLFCIEEQSVQTESGFKIAAAKSHIQAPTMLS